MNCIKCENKFEQGIFYCAECLVKDDGYIEDWTSYCKKLLEMRLLQ